MATFIMMVGVSGSGKSTIAMEYAEKYNAEVFSSDTIRGEIYGDENCQKDPGRVFNIMHQRTLKALRDGKSVVYDATNLSCKRRMNFLKGLHGINCQKMCVVVVTTPEDIEERMKHRDRKVPMEVVHKHLCQFQCPNYYEGWDKIDVRFNSSESECASSYSCLFSECAIPHDNPHHTLDIARHMFKASQEVLRFGPKGEEISYVALMHDIGKPRCKTFLNRDGSPSEVAHYVGHQNYSAYFYLIAMGSGRVSQLEDWSCKMILDHSCLIQWHMEHYLRNGEALERFYQMLGADLTKKLKMLEEADKAAH